jgi:ABC-type uncharacterized transport system substrate-binding protein
MLKTRRRLVRAAAAAGAVLCASMPAAAHPHMCVAVEATVLYEKGAFTGLQQKWTFDQAYTTTAVEGLDKNNDGRFDRSELAELAQVNVDALKEFDYFTYPVLAGQPVKLGEPKDYWLEHKDGLLSLHFTLPFAAPAPVQDKTLTLAVRDNSFFIGFGLSKGGNPVQLGSGAPKSCRLAVEMVDQEEQAVLKQIFDALGCTITVPKEISIKCNGP